MLTELVPHFDVADVRGPRVNYARALWQQRALVLVTLPPSSADETWLAAASAVQGDLDAIGATCVITRDTVANLPPYGLMVADRWGAVKHVQVRAGAPPPADELLDWADWVQRLCG